MSGILRKSPGFGTGKVFARGVSEDSRNNDSNRRGKGILESCSGPYLGFEGYFRRQRPGLHSIRSERGY